MKPRITVCRVCPSCGRRRVFRKLKRAIQVSDRRLAARLEMFGHHLNYDEDTPGSEQWVMPAAVTGLHHLHSSVLPRR